MPANNPGQDLYPHQTHVRTLDDQDDAWDLARQIAAKLVMYGLTPDYGVKTMPMINGDKSRRFMVQIGGPGALPSSFREEVERLYGDPPASALSLASVTTSLFDTGEGRTA